MRRIPRGHFFLRSPSMGNKKQNENELTISNFTCFFLHMNICFFFGSFSLITSEQAHLELERPSRAFVLRFVFDPFQRFLGFPIIFYRWSSPTWAYKRVNYKRLESWVGKLHPSHPTSGSRIQSRSSLSNTAESFRAASQGGVSGALYPTAFSSTWRTPAVNSFTTSCHGGDEPAAAPAKGPGKAKETR